MKIRNVSHAGHFSKANLFLKRKFVDSHFLSLSSTSQWILLYFFQLFHHLHPEISFYHLRNHRPPQWHVAVLSVFSALLLESDSAFVFACVCSAPSHGVFLAAGSQVLWCRATYLQRFTLGLKNRKRGQQDDRCQAAWSNCPRGVPLRAG